MLMIVWCHVIPLQIKSPRVQQSFLIIYSNGIERHLRTEVSEIVRYSELSGAQKRRYLSTTNDMDAVPLRLQDAFAANRG